MQSPRLPGETGLRPTRQPPPSTAPGLLHRKARPRPPRGRTSGAVSPGPGRIPAGASAGARSPARGQTAGPSSRIAFVSARTVARSPARPLVGCGSATRFVSYSEGSAALMPWSSTIDAPTPAARFAASAGDREDLPALQATCVPRPALLSHPLGRGDWPRNPEFTTPAAGIRPSRDHFFLRGVMKVLTSVLIS